MNIFKEASHGSYKIGWVMAAVHLAISWCVILTLGRGEPDAQWQLVWILFLPIDFPFSLLVLFSGYLFPSWEFEFLKYPISSFHGFIFPSIIHGIIGPLWYFLIPVFISGTFNKFRKK
ncbi:MAG: hypothetical protein AB7S81_03990 [Bdellovibrionales bacterium]